MGLGVNQILRQIYENGTKTVLIWVVIHLSDKQFICKTALDYKYIVLDVLVYSIRVLLQVVLYFDLPNRLVKIQITSENTQQYNTPKCPVSYLSSNCFFSAKSFYSFLAGKAKWIEKCSVQSGLVKHSFYSKK